MHDEDITIRWFIVVGAIIFSSFIYCIAIDIGKDRGGKDIQREAVHYKVAHWEVSDNGETNFKWNMITNVIDIKLEK